MKQGIFFDWQKLVSDTKQYLTSLPQKRVVATAETQNYFARAKSVEQKAPLSLMPSSVPRPVPKPAPLQHSAPRPAPPPQKRAFRPPAPVPKPEEKQEEAQPHRTFPYLPHTIPQATPPMLGEIDAKMAKYFPHIQRLPGVPDDLNAREKESAWKKNYAPIIALSFFDSKSIKEELFGTMVRAIGDRIAPASLVRNPTKAVALELAVLAEMKVIRAIIAAYDVATASRYHEFLSYLGLEAKPVREGFSLRADLSACHLFDLSINDGLEQNTDEKRNLWKQFQSMLP